MMNKIDKVPLNVFVEIITNSRSISEVLRKLKTNHARYFAYFKKRVQTENIDISHFDGNSTDVIKRKFTDDDIFVQGKKHNNSIIKSRFLTKVKEYKCSICGISEWNNAKIVLHLDHIDGDNTNNLIHNLRLLCPNCHSQTETYCRKTDSRKIYYDNVIKNNNNIKNNSKPKTQYKCSCGNIKYSKNPNSSCKECDNKKRIRKTKINWPDKETLESLIYQFSLLALGKRLGVSDNAVRKRCKKYGLL